LIADQKAELEELKQQLEEQSNDKSVTDLKEREEQLLLYEKEIEQLKVRLQNESPTPESEQKAEILAEKEKELQEKEAKLKEQERIMDEKVPEIEHVAMQLEELKIQVPQNSFPFENKII
jgi:hypothetical protein